MSMMVPQITSLMIVCSTIYSGADQIKHQSSVSLAFVRGIHRWPVKSLHKGPVTQKKFPFDGVIMNKIIQSQKKLNVLSGQQKVQWNYLYPESIEENVNNFIVNNVPADGLAPIGARASAGTVWTKFKHSNN